MILYFQIGTAFLMDLFAGDPRWFPHPVRFIGWLCCIFETGARKLSPVVVLKACGTLAVAGVLSVSLGCAWMVLLFLQSIHPSGAAIGSILLLYFCIAAGDLTTHSRRVHHYLVKEDIVAARKAVSMMVGRDTAEMDQTAVSKACIESVSENMVDGITAPLFWAFVSSILLQALDCEPLSAAALGGVFYKSVNTMDSMYGYKNERYLEFGWFAARFDDILTFIPARLSAVIIVCTAYFTGFNAKGAARIVKRDRLASPSPNSGHTEAAVAGALHLRLGGAASYFGVKSVSPVLGAEFGPPSAPDIIRCNRLVIFSSIFFFCFCVLFHLTIATVLG